MTISTPRTDRFEHRGDARGFTLLEVMIASAISAMILAGVMTAFLMLNRSTLVLATYSDMAGEVARGLEMFGQDARRATAIHWNSAQSITLDVAAANNATTKVTYAYDATAGNATYQCFYRVSGDASSTATPLVLVHHVAADFGFLRYKLSQPGVVDGTASSDLDTKRIAVVLRAARLGSGAPTATQSAVSASYVLRNKRVAN